MPNTQIILLFLGILSIGYQREEDSMKKGDYPYIDGIYVLNSSNFQQFIVDKETNFFLAHFYQSKGCQECRFLSTEFKQVAKEIEGTGIRLAEVDMLDEENKSLAESYKITEYPTLKFFRTGYVPQTYSGDRDKLGMLSWLKKNCPDVMQFNSVAQLEQIPIEKKV